MAGSVEFFGIRHHGPGSAKRLVEALDALKPVEVLIEGPIDLSDLLPMLAHPDMIPPVALLAYPAGEPEKSIFWPLAVFSPEYQAICWSIKNHVLVRFIDLPVCWRFQEDSHEAQKAHEHTEPTANSDSDSLVEDHKTMTDQSIRRDPIGALATAAGYEDGESWWQDVIEENPAPGPIFAAVSDAMRSLREGLPPPTRQEAAREAHMRLEIAASCKKANGTVAVVCGAWHVPALMEKHSSKSDRESLRGAPKRKISATWTPWTSPRLSLRSGYGAGVECPGWNKHLWESPRREQATRWLVRASHCLREIGQLVSTASLIEAQRLAVALAAIRGRSQVGFEELIDATLASICHGNERLWSSIADRMLIGAEVGVIPEGVPLAPLLEDLQRQQKTARLKPEALERELMLDLRSESGLFRSTLLHRLKALGVGWGNLDDPGRSRGTFRERWILRWEPEHAVALVENLVYGATIQQAACGRIVAGLGLAKGLKELADLVFQALTAQLPEAAARVSEELEQRVGLANDCLEMLTALPPIADVLRYGRARDIDTAQMASLIDRLATQASLSLHHASRNLDQEASDAMREAMRTADRAMRLIESKATDTWLVALGDVVGDERSTPLVAGQAARLLYESDKLSSDEAVTLLGRKLSPGTTISEAAGFFEGFLDGAGDRLMHDESLRGCVSQWILELEEQVFIETLPLFRRVFSNLDGMERQRLMAIVIGKETKTNHFELIENIEDKWDAHFQTIVNIVTSKAML